MDFDITYYLSGPMAGYKDHNFPAFEIATGQLRDAGLKILSPHEVEHPGLSGKEEEWKEYLANDLKAMVADTQSIILLRGWPQSRGAGLELTTSLSLLRPVYYYHNWMLTDMNRMVLRG